jgi:tetratricopeptide (TPR) repeat protein
MPSTDDEMDDMQGAFPPAAEGAYDFPRRRRVGGWVVALVLLLAVGVVGWVAAKPYLFARNAAATPPIDGRAQAFLADGEKALSDGDLEAAQQNFDKASALAENDTRVLVDEARVASARADVPWLKLRLLAPDAVDETRATKAQLDERLTRVRKAAEDAIAAAPDDHAAVRAAIDALRLQGRQDAARKYVSKIGGSASQPETAYVLAALDLAEPEPFWATVIDRLRSASAGESNAGRARAALVYALAKSGDVAGARTELAKLDALTRPYPCLPNLHAWVDRTPSGVPLDRAGAANIPHIDVSALPQARPVPVVGPNPGAGDELPGEQSGAMHAASQAIKKGDWSRARHIYEALVSRNPSDSEALAGIGDVERAQGDSAGAIDAYKRALAVNPSYLPALLGVADTQWASGDHASARRAYKDIVDRFPDGSYPSYVKPRADPAATSTAAPPAASATKAWDPGDGI